MVVKLSQQAQQENPHIHNVPAVNDIAESIIGQFKDIAYNEQQNIKQ